MADDFLNIRITADATGAVAGLESTQAAVAALEARLAELEAETNGVTASTTGMDRAMALASGRLVGYEAGLGMVGGALGRVGAASETLAPLLVAAFPVIAVILLVTLLDKAYDGLHKLAQEGERQAGVWSEIEYTSQSALLKQQEQIAGVEAHIANLTEGPMAALQIKIKNISDGSFEMTGQMTKAFAEMGKEIDEELTFFDKLKEKLTITANLLVGDYAAAIVAIQMPTEGELVKSIGTELQQRMSDVQDKAHAAQVGIDFLNGALERFKDKPRVIEQINEMIERLRKGQTEQADKGKAAQLDADKQEVELLVHQIEAQTALNVLKERGRAEQVLAGAKIEGGGTTSTENAAALAEKTENKIYQIRLNGLTQQMLAMQNSPVPAAFAAQEQATGARIEQLVQEHVNKVHAIRNAATIEDLNSQQKQDEEDSKRTRQSAERDLAEFRKAQQEKMRIADEEASASARHIGEDARVKEAHQTKFGGLFGTLGAEQTAGAAKDDQIAILQQRIDKENQYQASLKAAGVAENDPQILASQQRKLALQNQQTQAAQHYQSTVEQLHQKEAEELQKITASFNQNMIQWVNGSETFTRAMQKAWTSMADSFIENMMKMGEQMILNMILHRAISDETKLDDAKTAASGAYASASQVPMIGWLLGPIAAAAAFAGVMAFEQGGLVPGGTGATPALLHPNEMVLPERLSNFVQNAAANSSGGRPQMNHFTFAPVVNGDFSVEKHGNEMFQFMKTKMRRMGVNP